MCFEQAKRKENFTLCFVRMKHHRQHFSFSRIWNEYFEIWKPETVVAHRHWKEEYTVGTQHNRRRLALALQSVHRNVQFCIICCLHHRQNRLNTLQQAVVVLKICRFLTLFVICGSVIFRFVSSGNSQILMSFSYVIAHAAVPSVIISVWEAIWNKFYPTELPQPTEEEWKKQAD